MWYVCVCNLTNLCLPIVYFMCMIFGESEVQEQDVSNYSGRGIP